MRRYLLLLVFLAHFAALGVVIGAQPRSESGGVGRLPTQSGQAAARPAPCDSTEETCYRKRPLSVRAFQMTEERMWDQRDWPDHLLAAYESGTLSNVGDSRMEIGTLEGPHIVYPDAWIVQGPEGEIWAVRDDIFRKTYELIP